MSSDSPAAATDDARQVAVPTRDGPVLGVLFDIDGTLVDYAASERAAILAWLAACGLAADAAAADAWAEATRVSYARFTSRELGFAEQRLARVRAFLGRPLDDAAATAWFEGYRAEFERRWTVFADVVPVLDELALVPGLRLGLVSNSSAAYQRRKLTALGLADRFDCLIGSEDVGVAKPDPAIFRAGCAALGLPPSACAYVGDLPEVDALGAHAAGLRAVWLDRVAPDRADAGSVPSVTLPPEVPVITSLSVLTATLGIAEQPTWSGLRGPVD